MDFRLRGNDKAFGMSCSRKRDLRCASTGLTGHPENSLKAVWFFFWTSMDWISAFAEMTKRLRQAQLMRD